MMNNMKSNRNMIEQIKATLKELSIELYTIVETKKEAIELYFIKKNLDMRRGSNVILINLTVYRDFEKDGTKMRGSSSTLIYDTMSNNEMKSAIETAYYAASFVNNPFYEIPSGTTMDLITIPSKLMEHSLEYNALEFANALYAPDKSTDVFINSAEFFSRKNTVHIVNSNGIDVSYVRASISGEFITQCISPTDVEIYKSFNYSDLELEAVSTLAKDALELTKSRAYATSAPQTGTYNVILSEHQVDTILSYYVERSYNSYIYPGYSNYEIGTKVQGDDVKGELLNIELIAIEPYSSEGIPMSDRPLITEGVLNTIQGNSRLSYYLDIPAIGYYESLKVENGSVSLDDMKKEPYLHIVNFSDFQMDALSGDFAGEIRLAFLYDGTTITPVTGGSISGNISKYHNQLIFSKERQLRTEFDGPVAILLKDVSVAGC